MGPSRSLPPDIHQMAPTTDGPFYSEIQQITSVSPVPDSLAWAVETLRLPWDDLDPYALPPAAILGKVVTNLRDYSCRTILIAPGWPNMPWFWGKVTMSSKVETLKHLTFKTVFLSSLGSGKCRNEIYSSLYKNTRQTAQRYLSLSTPHPAFF